MNDARTTDRLAEIGPALEEAIRHAVNHPSRYTDRRGSANDHQDETIPEWNARAAMVAIQRLLCERDMTITTGEIAWRGTQPPPEPQHPGQQIAHIADAGAAAAAMIRALAIELGPDGHINGGDLEDLAGRIDPEPFVRVRGVTEEGGHPIPPAGPLKPLGVPDIVPGIHQYWQDGDKP